jgi:hypothetical protein
VHSSKGSDIIEEIESLLDALCAQAPTIHVCERCGSKMMNIDASFFFEDGNRGWNIPLPFCLRCDVGLKDVNAIAGQAAA